MAGKDPTIRLKIEVDSGGGASTVSGMEKVAKAIVDPLDRAFKRLQGYSVKGGKRDYFDLGDVVKGIEKVESKLTKLSGAKFTGLNNAFKDLGKTMDGVASRIEKALGDLAKMVPAAAQAAAAAANASRAASAPAAKASAAASPAARRAAQAAGDPSLANHPLFQRSIDAISGMRATGGGEMKINAKGVPLSASMQYANEQLNARITRLAGGSTTVRFGQAPVYGPGNKDGYATFKDEQRQQANATALAEERARSARTVANRRSMLAEYGRDPDAYGSSHGRASYEAAVSKFTPRTGVEDQVNSLFDSITRAAPSHEAEQRFLSGLNPRMRSSRIIRSSDVMTAGAGGGGMGDGYNLTGTVQKARAAAGLMEGGADQSGYLSDLNDRFDTGMQYGPGTAGGKSDFLRARREASARAKAEARAARERAKAEAQAQAEADEEAERQAIPGRVNDIRASLMGRNYSMTGRMTGTGEAQGGRFFVPGNWKQTSTKYDETGAATHETYERGQGSLANRFLGLFGGGQGAGKTTIDLKNGTSTQEITRLTTGIELLGKAARGAGGVVGGFIFDKLKGAFDALTHPVQTFTSVMLKLGAVFYTMRHLERTAQDVFVSPVKQVTERVLDSTERSRQFELGIMGVAGGPERAHMINDALYKASGSLPMTAQQMQHVGTQMALNPLLTSQMAFGSSDEVGKNAAEFAKVVSKLAVFDPEQGEQGVMTAIREGLAGDLTSLRRRLELSPDAVAASIGKTDKDIKADPALFLKALQGYANQYIPDSVLDQQGKLYSVQKQKTQDNIDHAFQQIGNSGVFDRIVDGMAKFNKALTEYFDSPQWAERAKSISDSLEKILGNTGDAILKFLSSLAGNKDGKNPEKTVDGIAGLFDKILQKFADWSKDLPGIAEKVGNFLHSFGLGLSVFIDDLGEYVDRIKNRRWFAEGNTAGDANALRESRAQATLDAYDRFGIKGGTGQYVNDDVAVEDYRAALGGGGGGAEAAIEEYKKKYGKMLGSVGIKNVPVDQMKAAVAIDREISQMNPYTLADPGRIDRRLQLAGIELPGAPKPAAAGGLPSSARAADGGIDHKKYPMLEDYQSPSLQSKIMNLPDELQARESIGLAADKVNDAQAQAIRSKFNSMTSAVGKIGETLNESNDPFRKVQQQAMGSLALLEKGFTFSKEDKPGGLLSKLKEYRQKMLIDPIDDAIKAVDADLEKNPDSTGLQDLRERLLGQQSVATKAFDAEMGKLGESIAKSTAKYGVALSEAIDKETPEIQAIMMERIVGGTTELAEKLKSAMQKAGMSTAGLDFGIGSMPLEYQPKIVGQLIAAQRANIQGRYETGLAPGMGATFNQLWDAAQHPQDKRTTQLSEITQLETDKPVLQNTYNRALAEYNKVDENGTAIGHTELNLKTLGEARALVMQNSAAMRQLKYDTNDALKAFVEFGDQAQSAIANGIGQSIENVITGVGKLGDVWKSVINGMLHDFTQSFGKTIMSSLFGAGGDQGRSGIGGLFATMLGGAQAPAAAAGSGAAAGGGGGITGWLTSLFASGATGAAAANGAVWAGGFTPIHAFANGGIVNRPVVGLVGEGQHPEAIIPMPNGRSVPVELSGSHGKQGDIYLVNNPGDAWRQGFRENRDLMIDTVSGNVRGGGKVHKAVKQKG